MNNRRNSKPLSIKDLTSQLFEKNKITKNVLEAKIQNTWEELMGNNVTKRTKNIFIKDSKLFIKISSSPLKNELNNSKKIILKNINNIHPEINELIFI
jgi:hypothetical protein|tara:strand:+ start:310 stop:603 length:294 start_codon:yes stop_codon:yes gene_type:complete